MRTFNEFLNENEYLVEMAQKQGVSSGFVFYTFDNEYSYHYPHIHICVKSDDKKFKKGRVLKNNKSLKTLGSIKIRHDNNYTLENLEFETLFDDEINTNKYKKIFIDWLNDNPIKRLKDYTNSDKCLIDYHNSNSQYVDKDKYIQRIDYIRNSE